MIMFALHPEVFARRGNIPTPQADDVGRAQEIPFSACSSVVSGAGRISEVMLSARGALVLVDRVRPGVGQRPEQPH